MNAKQTVWGLLIMGIITGSGFQKGFFGPDGNLISSSEALLNNMGSIIATVVGLIASILLAQKINRKLK